MIEHVASEFALRVDVMMVMEEKESPVDASQIIDRAQPVLPIVENHESHISMEIRDLVAKHEVLISTVTS